MSQVLVATTDRGLLQINAPFVDVLNSNGLGTFESLWNYSDGTVVRHVGPRETRRIELASDTGPLAFYLKRFSAPRRFDQIRSLLHLGWPIHGARAEWDALRQFIETEIPTVVPVACGVSDSRSVLVTEALPARCNLLEYVGGRAGAERAQSNDVQLDRGASGLVAQVAGIARRMHAAGLHHQDFYLNHMLLCGTSCAPQIHVIDLGRVRRLPSLSSRWIVKDLAQLNFSAERVSHYKRLRFLRLYLGRPFLPADRRLARRIVAKSRRIAAHTAKHDL